MPCDSTQALSIVLLLTIDTIKDEMSQECTTWSLLHASFARHPLLIRTYNHTYDLEGALEHFITYISESAFCSSRWVCRRLPF